MSKRAYCKITGKSIRNGFMIRKDCLIKGKKYPARAGKCSTCANLGWKRWKKDKK